MSELRLILALEKCRTTEIYGTNHFCKKHNQIVDKLHIDECDLINEKEDTKVTDLVTKLQLVDSIWEMEPSELEDMWRRVRALEATIARLEGN
jgi:hypothetical protein